MQFLDLFVTHNTTFAAILTLGLGIWVYFDRRHDPKHVSLGTLLVGVSAWSFSLVLWHAAADPERMAFWLRTLFFVGSLLPLLFMIFSFYLKGRKAPPTWAQAALALPNVPLFVTAYYSPLLVSLNEATGVVVLGSGRIFFAVHFAALMIISLGLLFLASRERDDKERSKFILLLIGTIVGFNSIFGIMFGASFTTIPGTILAANVGLVIGSAFMASSILEKRFLAEMKFLGPQLFALIVMFAIIFNIVVTETSIDLFLQGLMLIILASYAGLTTKTLLQEVRRAHQIRLLGEQAVELNKALIESDKMKSRFVSLASHQLRAPILGVRTYLDMFAGGDFGEITRQQKKILIENSHALVRLNETIDTFLDAAKIQLGKLDLFKTEANLGEIAEKAVNELSPLAAKKGLLLVLEVQPELPDLFCDAGKIHHVIGNLIDNAIKYSKTGSVRVKVGLEKDGLVVRVKDTGIGLEPEDRKHIFDVFARGMEAVRLDTGGSGLGLYIAKSIVDAHGGSMIVESAGAGKGSEFGFRLKYPQGRGA